MAENTIGKKRGLFMKEPSIMMQEKKISILLALGGAKYWDEIRKQEVENVSCNQKKGTN